MDLTCPAKINLCLEVISKRDDGYHELDTLFEKISIFDELSVEVASNSNTITCDNKMVPTDKNSLLFRTIIKFKEKSRLDVFFNVFLRKNIPIGAGLGGGSSDAAGLLKGMNMITDNPLADEELVSIAKELGSDIPFFLYDYSFARGKGRGDQIQKIDFPIKLWHIIVKPPFGISTGAVYNSINSFTLTKNGCIDRMITTFLKEKSVNVIAGNLRNDLQRIVLRDFPEIQSVFTELKEAGSIGTLLSGSGSCVYGIFTENTVQKAQKRIKEVFSDKENWRVFTAQTY